MSRTTTTYEISLVTAEQIFNTKAINTISNIITNIIDVISNNIIVIVLKKKNM